MNANDFQGPIGNATEKYAAGNPVTRKLLERFLRELDRQTSRLAPASLLDVGCGEGIVTERFARLLPTTQILGIDADTATLQGEWEERQRDNLSFQTGSAYELPFEDNAFELACAIEVLEHLERPRDALAEMARVASRALLVSVPREPQWRISHFLAGRDIAQLGNTPGHINHWSKAGFGRLVADYGDVTELRSPFPWTLAVAVGPSGSAAPAAR
ncbi:MAG TPA: class I SAM-dependent methyltransferase [Gaiellaceae bacterium]